MTTVALAYSGTLDTAICIHWLRKYRGMKVHALMLNLGQPVDFEAAAQRAIDLGAVSANIADVRNRFVTDYVHPVIRSNAEHESDYFLFSAIARPLIVEELVRLAREEDCVYVAHGSRGIGNDAIRFARAMKEMGPEIEVLSPLVDMKLDNPGADIQYADRHGIPYESLERTLYNVEENLWGVNIQIREARDPMAPLPDEVFLYTAEPQSAPAKGLEIEIEFESGVPVGLDGRRMEPFKLIDKLKNLGYKHGIGRFDLIEDRLSGVKTREVYEVPCSKILYTAHHALETLVLAKGVRNFQHPLAQKYGELVYEGHWFSTFRESLDAYFTRAQEEVTGTVRVKLQRGGVRVIGRQSPYSKLTATALDTQVHFEQESTVQKASGMYPSISEEEIPG